MSYVNDLSAILLLVGFALLIGWAGMPSQYSWMDKSSFKVTLARREGNWAHRGIVLVVAVIKYRPDFAISILLLVAAVLKTIYELRG